MSTQIFERDSTDSPDSPPSDITADEWAVAGATDLLAFFDGKNWDREMNAAQRVTFLSSFTPVANSVLFAELTAVSEPLGAYVSTVPGGTLRKEIRIGIDAAGAAVSGSNNKKFTGNAQFLIPATDWTFYFYLRILAPSSATFLVGSGDTTSPVAFSITSSYIIRCYPNYPSNTGLVATAASTFPNDGAYHTLRFRYDSVAKQIEFAVDGSVVKAMIACDLSSKVGQIVRVGTVTSAGPTDTSGQGWAYQIMSLIGSKDGTTQALIDTLLAGRPA